MIKIQKWIKDQKRKANDPSKNRSPIWKPLLWILPALLILGMFSFYPLINSVDTSMHDTAGYSNSGESYQVLFDPSTPWGHQMKVATENSIIYAVVAIPLGLAISILIAFITSKVINKFTRGFLQTVFFLPYVTSALAVAFTFLTMFDVDSGLFNKILRSLHLKPIDWLHTRGTALTAMLIYGIWRSLPFQILILTMSFLSVSSKAEVAARIDGANAFKRFFKISLPAIGPTLVYLTTIGIIGAMKVFPIGLFPDATAATEIDHSNAWTLVYLSYHFFKTGDSDLATASAIIILLLVLAFTLLNNIIRRALTPSRNYNNKIFYFFERKPYKKIKSRGVKYE